MVGIDRRLLQNVDWLLVGATLGLVTLSATTLATVSVGRAGGGVAVRQLAWFGVGILALLVVASIDYRRLVQMAPLLYLWRPGRARRGLRAGAHRVGRASLAPHRPAVGAALRDVQALLRPDGGLARHLALGPAGRQDRADPGRAGGPDPGVLIVKQPDLGTALLLFPVLIALFVAAGLRLRTLGGLVLAGVAALPLAWFAMKEYQRERILVFLDPFRDPLGSAYNVIQAKIAIGSGQLLGKGVAGATQSRLAFLPERHTDFIFAVFAETWGFVGCLVLLTCYALLLLRGFDIAASTREPVGRLVALGVTALVATQVIVNVGMVTGLIPVVGIPLPFMSYGGSSMVVSMMALGLLLSVRMRQFQ